MRQNRLLLPLAMGAAFLALLDVTVVNLAIPALGRAYPHAGLSSLSWVITAYAIAFAALLAPAGRMADVLGRRRLFRIGVIGFALMSAACAAAPNLPVLLVARGVQGGFAASMIPASLAVVLADIAPARRVAAIGAWSAAGAFAAAVGPSLGGVLVQEVGWRSLFVINVPVGLALALPARAIPAGGAERRRPPDVLGTVLLTAGVGLGALGLSQSQPWGWNDARTVAALAVGVLAAGAAIARSRRAAVPAIDTSLWRNRTFAAANASSLCYGISLYAWMLLGVLVLTQLWGYTELKAGLALSPGALAASIAAVLAGRAATRTGPRALAVAGGALMAGTGLFMTATLPRQPDFLGYWLPLGLVLGVGIGLLTTGTSMAGSLSLPPTAFAAGTGLNQTARQVGGALGIAALATLVGTGRTPHLATFEHAYLFVASAALAAGLIGFWLILPAPAVTAAPAATEADDPYISPSVAAVQRLPWTRVVAVGDSMAEGIGDPTPGYTRRGWTDRVGHHVGGAYLNLGRRLLLAEQIRDQQLDQALAFQPDLAIVAAGGNDLMRPSHDLTQIEASIDTIVGSLRAAGADVVMIAPFDITRTDLLPAEQRDRWHQIIEQLSALAQRVTERHGGIFVDYREHPAGAEASIYSADTIHLSARGHAIAAAELLTALSTVAEHRAAQPAIG